MPSKSSTMNSNRKFNLDQEDQNFTSGIEPYENLGTKTQ